MRKTLILTGASRGIGKALALELAKAGYDLVLNARSEEPLKAVAEEVRGLGARAAPVAGNAAKAEVAKALVESASEEAASALVRLLPRAGDFHGKVATWRDA